MLEHDFMDLITNAEQTLGNLTEIVGNTVNQLASVGTTIAPLVASVGAILSDPLTEEKNTAGDRVKEEILANTVIASQEATVENTMVQTTKNVHLETSTQDCAGNMTSMTDRWIKVTQINWTTAHKHFYLLPDSIKYPNDILKINTVFKSFLHFFAYYHCDIEIMATVTGTKFHQGAICVVYAVDDGVNSLSWADKTCSYKNMRMLPHTILNLQNATSGKFIIPYNNLTSLFDRENRKERGKIFLIPWSKMIAPPGGNATLPVAIFASLKNLKVYGMTKEKTPFSTAEYQRARDMFLKGIAIMEDSGKDTTFMRSFMKTVTETFPEAFADGVSTINVASHIFNTANVSQSETFVQDLSFMGETSVSDNTVTSTKPIVYSDLLKIPVPIRSFNWKVADPVGHVLWTDRIGVNCMKNITGSVKAKTVNYEAYTELDSQETLIDQIGKFARYWRGSLKFTFEFFNAGLMKGRVKIAIIFGETEYSSINSCYYITHDLGLEDKCEIVVPFNSWRDWMQVPSLANRFAETQNNAQTNKLMYKACSLGTIGIEVVNTLTTTNTMANNLDIVVSVSSDNLQLAWPNFSSQGYEYEKYGSGPSWDGISRTPVANVTTKVVAKDVYYPEVPGDRGVNVGHYMYGDLPLMNDLATADSFTGSFAAQSDVTTSNPVLPTTCPFRSTYIGNHVEVKTLMTRPALVAHATVWVAQGESEFTGANTFAVTGESGIIMIEPDNTGICEIGIDNKKQAKMWPWMNQIRPHAHQLEVCKIGSYWSGSAKLNIAISSYESATMTFDAKAGTASRVNRPGDTGGLLFLTFSDVGVLTTKDLMQNGAYCINIAQQKMASFNIPYYMIEQKKRLIDSDLSWRLFYQGRNEVTFDIHVWLSWGDDFELSFPTLIPTKKYFGGQKNNGISGKSWYYYLEQPSNWNKFPAGPSLTDIEEDEPVVEEFEMADGIKDLTDCGDVESNPGPTKCPTCDTIIQQHGSCPCDLEKIPLKYLLNRGQSSRGANCPSSLITLLAKKYSTDEIVTLNDIVGQFSDHKIRYKVTKDGAKIEIEVFFHLYQSGQIVYYKSLKYIGLTKAGIHKDLRARLCCAFLIFLENHYAGVFQTLQHIANKDFCAEGLFDSIKETMESLVCKIANISQSLMDCASFVLNAKQALDDARKRLIIFIAKILLNIANIIMNPTVINMGFVIANLTLDLISLPGVSRFISSLFESSMNNVLNCILALTNSSSVLVAHGLNDIVPSLLKVFSLLTAGVFGVSMGIQDGNSCVSSVLKTLKGVGVVGSGLRGISSVVDIIWKCFDGVLHYFQGGFTLEERSVLYFKENQELIFQWNVEVGDMEGRYVKGQSVLDEGLRSDVKNLFKTGKEISAGCLNSKETSHIFPKLRSNFILVSKWNQELLRLDGVFKIRPEPVVVYLYGAPGSGKSLAASVMARQLCHFMKTAPDNFYSLPPGFKYMDNYSQQPVVIIDDIGQASDDEDWKIFCQMVSSTPFIPPMADLQDKGMSFTSPVIICTSNLDQPQPATIKFHEAIWRRLKFKIEVETHRNFTNDDGSLDFQGAQLADKVHDMSCCYFGKTTDWQNKQQINFKQLMTEVKREVVRRRCITEKMTKEMFDEDKEMETMIAEHMAIERNPPPILIEPVADGLVDDLCDGDPSNLTSENWARYKEAKRVGKRKKEQVEQDQTEEYPTNEFFKKFDFVSCKQCEGKHPCILCENVMRIQDDIPIFVRGKFVKEAIEMSDVAFLAMGREIDEAHIDLIQRGKAKEFYVLCRQRESEIIFYNTLDYVRICIYRKMYMQIQVKYQVRLAKVKTYSKAIVAIVALIAAVAFISLAFKAISWFCASAAGTDAYQQGDAKKMRPVKTKAARPGVKPHADGGGASMLETCILRNQEYVTFYAGETACVSGMVTFLDSTTLITCKHLLIEPEDSKLTHIRILQDDVFLDLPFSSDRVTSVTLNEAEVDMVLVTFPNPIMGKRKITNSFVTEEQMTFVHNSAMHMLTKKARVERIVECVRPYIYSEKGKYADSFKIDYHYNKIIRYRMTDRGPGDSGGLVTTMNNGCAGKIFGMHVAGTSSYGMAIPLTKEIVEELLILAYRGKKDVDHIEPPPEIDAQNEQAHVFPHVGEKVVGLGTVSPSITIARQTDIRESPIHGMVFPVLRGPSALKANDPRVETNKGDPAWNMPKKFARKTGYVNMEYLDLAVEHCSKIVVDHSRSEDIRVLNDYEMINGMIHGETMEQIALGTSPGYSYSTESKGKGKRAFLEEVSIDNDGKTIYKATPKLDERMNKRISLAEQRQRIEGSYYQTALKNELRPLNKIKNNGGRTIEGCPLDYLLVFRKYIGSFANWMTKNYGTLTGSCVGCNPDVDWTHFYAELKEMGDDFIAVDFTNWDGSIPSQYLYAAIQIINNFYGADFERKWYGKKDTPEFKVASKEFAKEQNVRDVLFDELSVTISVLGDQLILTLNGLPSGHPLTGILNCLIHWLKMNVAYLEATEGMIEYHSLDVYEKHHKSLFYGDDGITAIGKKISHLFNRFSLAITSTKEGMECTMEDKEATMTAFSSIEEVSYLKRRFVPNELDSNIIMAPIEFRTIGSLLNWVKENGTFEQNVEDAMWFLYHHGSKIYDEYSTKIHVALAEVGMNMILPTWKQQFRNHQIKFRQLDSEWRTRPIIPQSTILLARALSGNPKLGAYLTHVGLDIKQWNPYYQADPRPDHLCGCGRIVLAKIDGICYHCHGVTKIPSWYYFVDNTLDRCLEIEKHHFGEDNKSWHYAHLNGTCLGGKARRHHICRECKRTCLHLSLGKKGRTCLECLGIEVPDWYFMVDTRLMQA